MDSVDLVAERSHTHSGGKKGAHLYVMQSESGPIKIGRSSAIAKRHQALEGQHGHAVAIVAVFPNRGHEEAEIHLALAPYRMKGEWFRDFVECRQAIRRLISHTIHFNQKLSPEAAKREKRRQEIEAHNAMVDRHEARMRLMRAEMVEKEGLDLDPAQEVYA